MALSLSHSIATFIIPTPEQSDPEPVRSNLLSARADFDRGEIREALRHLRRAAEGADEAGSEQRALALARAAADLATEVGSSVTPPPATVAPPSLVRGSSDAALRQLLDSGRAVKVVVKRSARDEGLYVLRRQSEDGQSPGLGTRQAIIVLLDADAGFFEPQD
jgi:hypothetical protein